MILQYHIAKNYGEVKLGQIDSFRVLARKMLANLQQETSPTLVIWNLAG